MQVQGEDYFLMNVWMDFLALLLAARLGRLGFSPGRSLLAALLGGIYALWAWQGEGGLRSVPGLLGAALGMCALAFGRRLLRALPWAGVGGLLLSGWTEWLMGRGAARWGVLLLSGGAVLGICRLLIRGAPRAGGKILLEIRLQGRGTRIPALRDSGNLLTDGISGRPVIVVSSSMLRPLVPKQVDPHDLATLPPSWFLVRARTAAGCKTLMCFRPDSLKVTVKGRSFFADAAVALADFQESRALAPDAIFRSEEENYHAVF